MEVAADPLAPRKRPVQRRSTATVDALHVATIQVLTREGLSRCTTTRVAERAGMSVGSLYQYYPNRDALLADVLARHLDGVADAVQRACDAKRGSPVADMAGALVTAIVAAKLRNPAESRALYAVAAEHGGIELVARTQARSVTAIAQMLATAPDARFADPTATAVFVLNVLLGPIRALLEGHAPPAFAITLDVELTRLLSSYLQADRRHQDGPTQGADDRRP